MARDDTALLATCLKWTVRRYCSADMKQACRALADLWIKRRQQEQAGSSDAEVRGLLVDAWRAEHTGADEFA